MNSKGSFDVNTDFVKCVTVKGSLHMLLVAGSELSQLNKVTGFRLDSKSYFESRKGLHFSLLCQIRRKKILPSILSTGLSVLFFAHFAEKDEFAS